MNYVRVKFSDEEYLKIKEFADANDLAVNKWLYKKAINSKTNKIIKQFYLFNRIIQLLEIISQDVKNNTYHENSAKLFFYLYLIEQHLQSKL